MKAWWRCALLAFLVLVIGRVFTSMPGSDEGLFFDPPYNWLTKGHTGTTIVEGTGFPWEGIERHMYWQPPMHLLIHTAWLGVFGKTLFSLRFCSLAAAIIALFMWRYLLRHGGVPPVLQGIVIVTIAVDYSLVRTGAEGRTDMLAIAFGLGAWVSYIHFRDRHFNVAILLSQTLVVCGGLTHPMGGIPYLLLILLTMWRNHDWKRLRLAHAGLAALPYLVGAAAWGVYILQEPQTFKRIFVGSSMAGRVGGFFSNPFAAIGDEIKLRYLEPYGWGRATSSFALRIKTVIPLVYFAGALAAWLIPAVRRAPHMRFFLPVWSVMIGCLLLLDGQRNGVYLSHVLPLYAILLATVLWWSWERGVVARWAAAVGGCAFLLLQIGGSAYIIFTNPYRNDYLPAVHFVQQQTAPGAYIVGGPEMGFGLGFDNILDDLTLGYNNHKKPDVIVINARYRNFFDAFKRDKPEIYRFVTDRLQNEYRLAYHEKSFEIYLPAAKAVAVRR